MEHVGQKATRGIRVPLHRLDVAIDPSPSNLSCLSDRFLRGASSLARATRISVGDCVPLVYNNPK
jgi:hypothetical protein